MAYKRAGFLHFGHSGFYAVYFYLKIRHFHVVILTVLSIWSTFIVDSLICLAPSIKLETQPGGPAAWCDGDKAWLEYKAGLTQAAEVKPDVLGPWAVAFADLQYLW